MAVQEDDDPLWKRILTNETLWLILAAIVILGIAFHLATSRPEEKPKGRTGARPGNLTCAPAPAALRAGPSLSPPTDSGS
jgi:hypothetical protein